MPLMRSGHETVFLDAARKYNCYILVRPVNEFSDPYFGRSGYTPKPMVCKAKTSNVLDSTGKYKHAGLVVNPHIFPNAFKNGKHKSAVEWWDYTIAHDVQKVLREDKDEKSPHFGCLLYRSMYIYGDYDLYDVIPADDPASNTAKSVERFGQIDYRGPLVGFVQGYINATLKIPVVRHGAEAQFQDHSEQYLYFFGPKGENYVWLNEATARYRYMEQFAGRQTLEKGMPRMPSKRI